jgi:hypothetical protein
MTTPVSARDHANMTVAEREFTFDALLADFDKLEDHVERDTSVSAPADVKQPQAPQTPDASAPHSARSESTSAARETAARDVAPETTAPDAAPLRAAEEPRTAKPRRTRELPSPEVLKLAGLIVVAALSLTLVFIALSR